LVAGLVALVYVGQARVAIAHPHRFDYVKMDFADVRNGHGSSLVIERAAAEGPLHRDGYDGQFSYFIALDPVGAAPYLGAPAYRYGRIGYPLVVRVAALGKPDWVRGSLVVVNALAIAAATTAAVTMLHAPLVVVFTMSGFSARIVSAHRPGVSILVLTDQERTYRQLALVWGVILQLVPHCDSYDEMMARAKETVVSRQLAGNGDRIIVTAGVPFDVPGTTNLLKVETV
jgi:hypothetical protein